MSDKRMTQVLQALEHDLNASTTGAKMKIFYNMDVLEAVEPDAVLDHIWGTMQSTFGNRPSWQALMEKRRQTSPDGTEGLSLIEQEGALRGLLGNGNAVCLQLAPCGSDPTGNGLYALDALKKGTYESYSVLSISAPGKTNVGSSLVSDLQRTHFYACHEAGHALSEVSWQREAAFTALQREPDRFTHEQHHLIHQAENVCDAFATLMHIRAFGDDELPDIWENKRRYDVAVSEASFLHYTSPSIAAARNLAQDLGQNALARLSLDDVYAHAREIGLTHALEKEDFLALEDKMDHMFDALPEEQRDNVAFWRSFHEDEILSERFGDEFSAAKDYLIESIAKNVASIQREQPCQEMDRAAS